MKTHHVHVVQAPGLSCSECPLLQRLVVKEKRQGLCLKLGPDAPRVEIFFVRQHKGRMVLEKLYTIYERPLALVDLSLIYDEIVRRTTNQRRVDFIVMNTPGYLFSLFSKPDVRRFMDFFVNATLEKTLPLNRKFDLFLVFRKEMGKQFLFCKEYARHANNP